VFVRLRLERHTDEAVRAFEAAIAAIDQIVDCWLMSGDTDYLLRVLIDSLPSYERFIRGTLHRLPGVASIDTSFAYGIVKQGQALPVVLDDTAG